MPNNLVLGVLALLAVVAVACGGSAPTPLPEASATEAPTPDLPATVAAEVEAVLAARATSEPIATPTPETQAEAPTDTPLPPVVAAAPTPIPAPQVTIPALILPATVATVQLVPVSASPEEGETRQLQSVVSSTAGNQLTGRPVAWISSNSAVAQVSATGLVTGISAGVASVTATVDGVGAVATIAVRHGPVASVEIALGDGAQLVAILRDGLGHLLQDRVVTWSSSDPGVLQVDPASGALAAGVLGTTTVTATAQGVSAAASVQVSNEPVVLMAVAPETVSLEAGGTIQLSAAPQDSAGQLLSGRTVTWSSSDPGVAQVSATGVVSGVSVGITTVTANSEGIEATATVTVTPVSVFLVALSSGAAGVEEGQSVQISAEAQDADGQILAGRAVAWSSSDDAVAQVSGTGLVTGVSAGTAAITATVEGVSGTATIDVSHGPVVSVEIGLGAGNQLVATLRDGLGHLLEDRAVTWFSSDPGVVGVQAQTGQLMVGSVGVATVTATAEEITASATITVNPEQVASITVTPDPAALEVGANVQLAAAPKDGAGNLLTGQQVVWSSNREEVATVSPTGLVTGVSAGTALVTARVGEVKWTAIVNVSAQSVLAYNLLVSDSSNRSNPIPLEGATVSGDIYVFTDPDQGVAGVSFYLDDPGRKSSPYRSEGAARYDLAGTQNNGNANGFDADQLGSDGHAITAEIALTDGRTVLVTANFGVEAIQAAPPPPLPPETYSLLWSASSNRSNPMPLDDVIVSGIIYMFTSPDQGVAKVSFYLDDPQRQGPVFRTENNAPYDVFGTRNDGRANGFDTAEMGTGPATVTAEITFTDGSTVVVDGSFTAALIPVAAPSVELNLSTVTLAVDENETLVATVRDGAGNFLPDSQVTWSSTNEGVVKLFASLVQVISATDTLLIRGVVPGTTTITATAEGVSATASITVILAYKSVSAGWQHTCGIATGRDVYCWGFGQQGQLGIGPTSAAFNPIPIVGGLKFQSVSAGPKHTCGVTSQGKAYCWGSGGSGRLGNGSEDGQDIPLEVDTGALGGLTFTSVSAGDRHTCGVTTSGEAYCWGVADRGELGIGSLPPLRSKLPLLVTGGHTFDSVSAGKSHTCGITTDGEAYCWGRGGKGQLGSAVEGLTPDYREYEPVPVDGNHTFESVSTGENHTCGITTDGEAYCWGVGDLGRLGNGSATGVQSTPVPVLGELTFESVSAGESHTCAVTTLGAAYCWGYGENGQLGNGPDPDDQSTPSEVLGGHAFASVSAGTTNSCGVTLEGELYCWGATLASLFFEDPNLVFGTPLPVRPPPTFTLVSGGIEHTCAIATQGQAYCWGWGTAGRLGNGTDEGIQATPQMVLGGHTFVSLSVGSQHTCGITTQGPTYCWGAGFAGTLGNGTDTSNQSTPVLVLGGHDFESVSAGQTHTCGVTTEGDAYCWGGTEMLGIGMNGGFRGTPQLVLGEHTWVSVAAGGNHTCGITTQGPSYCWGAGFDGQLGDGSTEMRLTPVLVLEDNFFDSLSAGSQNTCGIQFQANAYCWGGGSTGQLGDGSAFVGHEETTPNSISGELTLVSVSVGRNYACGITDLGDAYCWGLGISGQLGNGLTDVQTQPKLVSGGLEFQEISTGSNHTCAITVQYIIYCWGESDRGQTGLGLGLTFDQLQPAPVTIVE